MNPGKRSLVFALLLAVLCPAFHAPACAAETPLPPDTIDRVAAYKGALPLYQYNARAPLSVKVTDTKTFPDSRMARLSYRSAHAQRVPALLFVPPGASKTHPVPCLILLHGLGANKELMAGVARAAAAKGYASLAIDEWGQGERAPKQSKSLTQSQLQADLTTGIPQTVLDVRRGIDYLSTRPNIDHKRIGLLGVSLGAIIGTVAAGVDTRIKATVLVSGGGDLALILKSLSESAKVVGGRQTAALRGVDWGLLRAIAAPEDPLTFAPHIAPRALLMECGRKDTTIVPQAAQALYDAARQPKQIDWYPNAGHVPPPDLIYPAIRKWLNSHL